MTITALNHEINSMLFIGAILTAMGTALSMWIAYLVIKAAIRDGIKESGLVDALGRKAARDNDTRPMEGHDMWADR